MTRISRVFCALLAAVLALLTGPSRAPRPDSLGPAIAVDPAQVLRTPLHFEPNRGQAPAPAQYLSRGPGYDLRLDPGGASLGWVTGAEMRLTFAGARPAPRLEAEAELAGTINYLVGRDERRWLRGLPTYGRVRYHAVYPGIDLVFYGNQRQLEYDLNVAPGADPSAIRLRFDGADRLAIDARGDLLLHAGERHVRQHRPVIYQDVDGARVPVEGRYRLVGSTEVAFDVGAYDRSRPLVIDPVLDWSTYLGGSADDWAAGVALNSKGEVIVVGTTHSTGWLLGTQGQTPATKRGSDIFITAFGQDGAHHWTTIFGGNGPDEAGGIAIDKSDNIYITGTTASGDYPTSAGALIREWPSLEFRLPVIDETIDTGGAGSDDALLTKFNANATNYGYSTYLGASPELIAKLKPGTELKKWKITFTVNPGHEAGRAIVVDDSGIAYVAGLTTSPAFPTTSNAAKDELDDILGFYQTDAFVMKIDTKKAGDQSLIYSTYVGGNCGDNATGLAVGHDGTIYVTGNTEEQLFLCGGSMPTTPGAAHPGPIGGSGLFSYSIDAFVVAINPNGPRGTVRWSTHIGTTDIDRGGRVVVDPAGKVYATYRKERSDSVSDLYLVGLSADGTRELWNAPAYVSEMQTIAIYPAPPPQSGNDPPVPNPLGNQALDPLEGSFPHALVFRHGVALDSLFVAVARYGQVGLHHVSTTGVEQNATYFGNGAFANGLVAEYRTAYVVGGTTSAAFGGVNGAQPAIAGALDAFVARVVHNPPPTLTARPVPRLLEGDTLNAVLADISGATTYGGAFTATIEWGDGATSSVTPSILVNGVGTIAAAHRYLDDGMFPVSICLKQTEDSGPTCTPGSVTVDNVPPDVVPASAQVDTSTVFAQYLGKPNGSVEVVLSRSASVTDPGLNDTHTGSIAWGDGLVDHVAVIAGNREFPLARHTYAAAGTKRIDVCATDDHVTNCDAFDLVVPGADLAVARTGGEAAECSPFSYTVTVRNNGPNAAQNVILTDRLANVDDIRRKLAYLSVLVPGGGGAPVGSVLAIDPADYEYQWGRAVAIDESGTTAVVVGAKFLPGPPISAVRRAAIYERDSATLGWQRVQTIDFATVSGFAQPLASISGRYLVLGANNGTRVYEKIGAGWSAEPIAVLEAASDVVIRGDTIALGASFADGGRGKAYIYERILGTWARRATLTGQFDHPSAQFGSSVGVTEDGGTVAIAEFYGLAAYVYTKTPTGWTLSKKVTQPTGDAVTSLAISGDRLVLGSAFDDVSGVRYAGALYVFRRSGADWVQEAQLLPPSPSQFNELGIEVALSGTLLAAAEDGGVERVRLFARNGTTWTHVATLAEASGLNGAPSVAIGGGAIVVGQQGANRDGATLPGAGTADAGLAAVYGSAAQEDGTLTVNLGTLAAGDERTVVIFATAGAGFTADTNATGTATVTGGAVDPGVANNQASSTITIRNTATTCFDTTGPIVTPTVSGTLGENGWYTSDVTVAWSSADPESPGTVVLGAECATRVLTDDTPGAALSCSAASAGGTASSSVSIKIDRTPPTIAVVAEELGGSEYSLAFECADAGSGVAVCPETVAAPAGALIARSVVDGAGNRGDVLMGVPRAAAGADQIVEVQQNCVATVHLDGGQSIDPGSLGLTYTWTGPFGTVTGATPDLVLSPGEYEVTLTVRNPAGVTSTDTAAVTVLASIGPVLHNVPPSMTIEQTRDGTPPITFDPPMATAACDPVTVTSDAPDTYLVGDTTVTFTATDAAGNMTQAATVVTVVPRIDVGITQTFVGDPIAGANAVYRITLTNTGPADATRVVVTPAVPEGTALVPVDTGLQTCTVPEEGAPECQPILTPSLDAACTIEGGALVCRPGSVPAGGQNVFDLLLAIPASRTAAIEAAAAVTASQQELDPTNNEAADSFPVARVASLALARSFQTTTLVAGTGGEYVLTVSNLGPSDATSLRALETLPPGMRITTPPEGCEVDGGTLVCTRAGLGAGLAAMFGPIAFEIDPDAGAGPQTMVGTATASETVGGATATTNLLIDIQLDASVALVADGEAVAGASFLLRITTTNGGPSAARNVALTLGVPAALASFGAADGCSVSTSETQAVAECVIPAIDPGAPRTLSIPVTLAPSARGSLRVDAAIVAAHDSNGSNDGTALTTNLAAHADLALAMTATPGVVTAGERVTYALHLGNDGPSDALGARIDMPRPANTTFVAGQDCEAAGASVSCAAGGLAAGASREFTVTLHVDQFARGQLVATARASSGAGDPAESDPDDANNTATATVDLLVASDLAVAFEPVSGSAIAGTAVALQLTGTNAGPSGAKEPVLTLTLPGGVTVPQPPTTCTVNGPLLTCHLADLAAGAAVTFDLEAHVDGFARGALAIGAAIGTADADPAPDDNTASVTLAVEASIDVATDLADEADPAVAGTPLTYTLGVTNTGPSGATGVTARLQLPAGVTLRGVPAACAAAGALVTCPIDPLASDARTTLVIVVDVDPFTRGTLGASASVAAVEPDTEPANDASAQETAVTGQADLRLTLADAPDPAVAGAALTYTIAITNDGPSGATSLTVIDTLPAGVALLSSTPSGACTVAAGMATCALPDLAPGGTITLLLVVRPSAPGLLDNTAAVSAAEIDLDPTDNAASTTTGVSSAAEGPAGAGDFDGDGDLDLALADEDHDRLKIFLNDGHGHFTEHARLHTGRKPKSVAVGDLDRDGDLDLAVANGNSDDVSIFAGDGHGEFESRGRVDLDTHGPSAVVAADLDGDGDLDLAVAGEQDDEVVVLVNDGAASFTERDGVSLHRHPRGHHGWWGWFGGCSPARQPVALAAGDFDGDGDVDLATGNRGGASLSILTNTGGLLTVVREVDVPGPFDAVSLTAADLDGDGDLDLAAAGEPRAGVVVFTNDGAAGFVKTALVAIGRRPTAITAGDFTGDGWLNLAAASRNEDEVAVLANDGAGRFPRALVTTLDAGRKPIALLAGDFDGDGDLDLVAVSSPWIVPVFLPNGLF